MIRTVKTNLAFNGMPRGYRFTYDPDVDQGIEGLLKSGLLTDITEQPGPERIVFEMPSIETGEKIGEIDGKGENQSPGGAVDDRSAIDASGDEDVQGNKGTRAKVAKGR